MCTNQEMQNSRILDLQNALIRQCIDQLALKNDAEDFAERADFYEHLYNSQRADFYNLEIQYKNLKVQHEDLEYKYVKLKKEISQSRYSKEFVNNLGSFELLAIIMKRLKSKFGRLKS